jgi:hypothetical protein
MPTYNVPDPVVFGPTGKGPDFNYGQVRGLLPQAQIEALRLRHEAWLVAQAKILADSGSSPFPLAVMTCVGMEALGLVAFGPGGALKDPFVAVAGLMDARFAAPVSPTFKTNLVNRWTTTQDPEAKPGRVTTNAELLYFFFRNSMIHGFRGRGVFLTGDETQDFVVKEPEGTMILNPWWLWRSYEAAVTTVFNEIVANDASKSPKRANAEQHLALMLS